MEKEKRMISVNGETPLPEAVIHHIQSYMSRKEAARSTLLSKSWCSAWLTRPSIDLDDRDFCRRSPYKFREFGQKTILRYEDFREFGQKTVQRYQDLSLKIDSFRLRVEKDYYHTYVDKLIVKALKIGATHLQLELPDESLPQEVLASQTLLKLSLTDCKIDGNDVVISCSRLKSLALKNVKFTSVDVLKDILRCCCNSLEELELSGNLLLPFSSSSSSSILPQEVLASQTLLKLSLTDCKIDGNYVVFSCSRLKSLTLKNVKFTSAGVDVLKDILRCCCNSLEEFELSVKLLYSSSSLLSLLQEVLGCQTLVRLSLSRYIIDGKCLISCSNLKSLTLQSVLFTNVRFKDIMTCCISMEELSLSNCKGFGGLSGANMYELHKLRRLFLSDLSLDTIFCTDFASRFPCLEDLTIHHCDGCTKIQIASTSLQTISFKPMSESWRAEFDVPNIRKFTYSGTCLPSHKLSIKDTASRKWDFDISIGSNKFFKRDWFQELKRYLTKYGPLSRISLSINLYANSRYDESEHEDDAFFVEPKPLLLENLMIDVPPSYCCALLVRLFGISRPKFITHDWSRHDWDRINVSLDIICKRLITPESGIPDQSMFGQFNLKKVNNVEVYEMFDTEWRPLLLEEPLDATKTPVNKRRVRFELIWD